MNFSKLFTLKLHKYKYAHFLQIAFFNSSVKHYFWSNKYCRMPSSPNYVHQFQVCQLKYQYENTPAQISNVSVKSLGITAREVVIVLRRPLHPPYSKIG